MCFKTITIYGVDYHFDSKEDRLLKRGLLDIYELSDNPDEWVVLDEYIFWSSRLQSIIIIPRWMVTDLASVPKGFRWLISVNERHRIPSLPHDFGYKFSDELKSSKEDWDNVFNDFMKVFGTSTWKRYLMYMAVKVGGKSSWEDNSVKFIPKEHRLVYKDLHKHLNLDIEDGKYVKP